jgi:glycosyltransferase involved in cell wall biosynthesis
LRISISATNPCHLYPMAVELARLDALGAYYSGYPEWKLPDREGLPIRTHSVRTTIVYGLLKYAPARLRPNAKSLFRWQDHGLDRWVGHHLEPCDCVHAMPGQALETFRGATRRGIKRVLNHATGPVRDWVRLLEPEYARAGLRLQDFNPYDDAYFAREDEEYALADFHCAASTVVAEQLQARGIPEDRIWVVPYGADERIFHPGENAESPRTFRIAFAGQFSLRKGMKTLLDALTLAGRPEWEVHFYGGDSGETGEDFAAYKGAPQLIRHGAVSQQALADGLRASSVLVLPSLEEGFGLVVPQALNCGVPTIVSDRAGGGDLVVHRENGSHFPAQNAERLAEELTWWAAHPKRLQKKYGWDETARTLLAYTRRAW